MHSVLRPLVMHRLQIIASRAKRQQVLDFLHGAQVPRMSSGSANWNQNHFEEQYKTGTYQKFQNSSCRKNLPETFFYVLLMTWKGITLMNMHIFDCMWIEKVNGDTMDTMAAKYGSVHTVFQVQSTQYSLWAARSLMIATGQNFCVVWYRFRWDTVFRCQVMADGLLWLFFSWQEMVTWPTCLKRTVNKSLMPIDFSLPWTI